MADGNPFASLVTPEVLQAQRKAEFEQRYEGADPWVRMAAEGGFAIRENNRARGIGLGPQDIAAKRNAAIMTGAQSRFAQLVKDGKMTADEAQAAVMQEAIAGFSANGSWEQALALTGPWMEITKGIQERKKLLAQTTREEDNILNDRAKAEASVMTAQAALDRAKASGDLSAAKIAEIQYNKALTDATIRLRNAQAEKALRPDAEGDTKLSAFKEKELVKNNSMILGHTTAARLMKQIFDIGVDNPAALTQAGPLSTQLSVLTSSTKALIEGRNFDPDMMNDGKTTVSDFIRNNVSDVKLQSLVTDLAFAFARSRDPGGRLSNQDVENAQKIVSGAGSPQARIAVLVQAYNNMEAQVKDLVRSNKAVGINIPEDSINMFNEAGSEFKTTIATYGKKPTKAPPATNQPLSRAEWLKQQGGK